MSMLPDGHSRAAYRYVETKRVSFAWTQEREEVVRARWMEGWSASQIAHEIGAQSRNVVIGKLHRLGLTGHPDRQAPRSSLARPPRPRPTPDRGGGVLGSIRKTLARKRGTAVRNRAYPGGHDAGLLYRIRNDADGPDLPNFPAHLDEPASLDLTILQLTSTTCRWPHGDAAPFTFCGHAIEDAGQSYCPFHHRLGRSTNPGKFIREATDLNAPGDRYVSTRAPAVMSDEAAEATAS